MALGTNLPVWPALLFTYLEPSKHHLSTADHDTQHASRRVEQTYSRNHIVTTLLGCHAAYSDPTSFVSRQLPIPSSILVPIPKTAIILAYSLGSIFLLFALLNILCTALTRDVRVTKYYLAILMVGDVGHLYANYKGMGGDVFWEFGAYNEVMIGNVWITVFLLGMRGLTLSGVFGRVGRSG